MIKLLCRSLVMLALCLLTWVAVVPRSAVFSARQQTPKSPPPVDEWGDDFSGRDLDQAKWERFTFEGGSGGTIKLEEGQLRMRSVSGARAGLRTKPAFTGDHIFRVCFIDPFQGAVMAKFAANTLKANTAAIMLDFNSPYSRGLTEFFERSFAELGGKVVNKQSYT